MSIPLAHTTRRVCKWEQTKRKLYHLFWFSRKRAYFVRLKWNSWNSTWILRREKIDFQYSSMASWYHIRFRLPSRVYQYLRAFQIESFHRLLRLVLIQILFECNNAFWYISALFVVYATDRVNERTCRRRGSQAACQQTPRPICLSEKIGYIQWESINIWTVYYVCMWHEIVSVFPLTLIIIFDRKVAQSRRYRVDFIFHWLDLHVIFRLRSFFFYQAACIVEHYHGNRR